MKTSAAIALLILAAAALIGWADRRTLASVSDEKEKLARQAAALGILATGPGHPEKSLRLTKRGRVDKKAETHQAALDFIAFAKESDSWDKIGAGLDAEMRNRILDYSERMLMLDAGQLGILIAEFRSNPDIPGPIRQKLLHSAIQALVTEHPEAALAMFTGSDALIGKGSVRDFAMIKALHIWSSRDPEAALAWIRGISAKQPELVGYKMKEALVRGAARNKDMAQVFKFIGELGFGGTRWESQGEVIRNLVHDTRSPEERADLLAAFREHMKTSPEGVEEPMEIIRALGITAAKGGFAEGSEWISANGFSDGEIAGLVDGIAKNTKEGEAGLWIDWMGEHLAGKELTAAIDRTMGHWTRSDSRAAGEWLVAAPPSPVKEAAVAAYAENITAYDPQAAVQWALTLPPGEKRQTTLKAIHRIWSAEFPEAGAQRAAFAAEHGIE